MEGDEGLLGVPRPKLLALMEATVDVCLFGIVDLELLESLLGSWAYVFSFRRPLFALFCHVYRQAPPASAGRSTPFLLHPWARNELLLAAVLAPLSLADLRVSYLPMLF